MKRWITLATVVFIALASKAVASNQLVRAHPTCWQAHKATQLVLDDYADLVDGELFVGPCRRAGRHTMICRARIDGPSPYKYRILVTETPEHDYVITVRAR